MVGRRVLHYEVLDTLGEGGMGVVYLAEDTKLHRKVALKFLPRELSSSTADRERLKGEARLAASLNHPNVATVYAIEEVGDELFLAMEYLPGLNLKETIRQPAWSQVDLARKIEYAIQIAEGLSAAHRRGIIHRDVKTSNIAVTPDGTAKILDFGIARPQESPHKTGKGQTPGTVAYMSPEQARGDQVDFRTDIWSFGVVLFELLTGQLPFSGKFEQVIFYSILHEKAKRVRRFVPSLPEELDSLVARTLEKDPARRFQSIEEVLSLLKEMAGTPGRQRPRSVADRLRTSLQARRGLLAGAALGGVALIAFLVWMAGGLWHEPPAAELTKTLSSMVGRGDYAAAFAFASEHELRLREDPMFAQLQLTIFDTLTVRSSPSGATAVLRRISRDGSTVSEDSMLLGPTPRENVRIARGEYLITLTKAGYWPLMRLVSSTPILRLNPVPQRGIALDLQLVDTARAPASMVRVPPGVYRLADPGIQTADTVYLDEFFIDQHEVSNDEYRAFVRAGGYMRRELWKYPLVTHGKTIPWEDAMRKLVDRTELPGPREWIGQSYPEGKGDHPVTGITWYEAAAFAEFNGKSLPTLHQWEKAARNGMPNHMGLVMPWGLVQDSSDDSRNRSNYQSEGTSPVMQYMTGMSPFGCLSMAGNAREWLSTGGEGGRLAAGGSWKDPYYVFSRYAEFPEFFSSDDLGFRCVRNSGDPSRQGAPVVHVRPHTPTYRPLAGVDFASLAGFYNYDRTPVTVASSSVEEYPEWRKVRISFSGSDGENIIAYLFLPRIAAAPYQCLVLDPHGFVYAGVVQADKAVETILGPHIRSGRALFIIVPKGSLQRPWSSGEQFPPLSSVVYRDRVIRWARDNRIGIDYLGSRGDIDMRRLAFMVLSNEGGPLLFPALEPRYRTVLLVACGLPPEVMQNRPETNPVNFLPHYSVPTLVMNGRYDEIFSTEQCARPLFNLLPDPKRLVLLNSGHAPPLDQRVPVINRWLDDMLGPVAFSQ